MGTQSTADADQNRPDTRDNEPMSFTRRTMRWYLQSKIDHSSIHRTSGWTLLLALVVTTVLATGLNRYQMALLDGISPLLEATRTLVHPTLIVYIPLTALVIGVILMRYGSLSLHDLGVVKRDLPLGIATLASAWILMQIMGAYTMYSNGTPLQVSPTWTTFDPFYIFGDFFGQLLGNAPFEEIVFRAVLLVQLYKLLLARIPRIPARISFLIVLVVSQAIFALYHIPSRLMAGVSLESLLPAIILPFIIGIVLALVYYRTGNIFVPIVLHTFLNSPMMVVGTGSTGMATVFVLMIVIVIGWPLLESGFNSLRSQWAEGALSITNHSPRSRPFAWFLIVTFGVSWTAWFLQYTRPNPMDIPGIVLFFIGGIGPFLGALFVSGRTGIETFRHRLLRFRVPISRYVGVLLAPLGMALGFVVVLAGIQGSQFSAETVYPLSAYPGMLISGILFGGLEEPGWRGFAQAHLQKRFSWRSASLIVGIMWVLWHAPLFIIPGTTQANIPIEYFALLGIGLSIVFAWTFNWAKLSVPILILLHGGINAAQGWSGVLETGLMSHAMGAMVAVVWIVALLALLSSHTGIYTPLSVLENSRTLDTSD